MRVVRERVGICGVDDVSVCVRERVMRCGAAWWGYVWEG